jgi:hypothetical protein
MVSEYFSKKLLAPGGKLSKSTLIAYMLHCSNRAATVAARHGRGYLLQAVIDP